MKYVINAVFIIPLAVLIVYMTMAGMGLVFLPIPALIGTSIGWALGIGIVKIIEAKEKKNG